MLSISNKHEEIFNYLVENSKNFHRGAIIANIIMKDISTISIHIKEIVDLEHKADKVNQEVIMKLCKVFITPIDREDFYQLSCGLESCIDTLQGSLIRINLYHIDASTPAAIEITEQIELMGIELETIFSLLKNINRNEAELMERANRLSQIETEIDNIYRRETSRIFGGGVELLDIIRWKDILNSLEETADKVESLGNIIKEVTMKYA